MSHTRNLTSLYQSPTDPQIAKDNQTFIECVDSFVTKRDSNDADLADPQTLAVALSEYSTLMANYPYGTRELCYRYLLDTTQGSDETKQRLGQAEHMSRQQMVRLQFFELALGQIPSDHHDALLANDRLVRRQHYLQRVRASAQHDLSRETEKAMTLLSKSAYSNRADLIEDALKTQTRIMTIDGTESEKSFEELMTLTKHSDKTTRDQAAAHVHEIMQELSYMATRELNSILEYKLATDTLRDYDRPDGSRILSEDVSPEVVDALLQAVSETNDIARDFYTLKARLMGVEQLAYHERNVTISLTDQSEPTYSYEQGAQIVRDVFAMMDDDFVQIFDRMREQGHIDVYPRAGKRGGAFNAGMGQNVINLVMLNYTDTLTDVTTLAHEMGHACHTQLSYRHQDALSTDYGMLTAEVSSTFIEDYVYEKVTSDLDDRQRLELLMQQLNDSISSVHRQIACYRYEQAIHREYRETGFVSTERLGELFTQYMSDYMGDAVSQDDGAQNRRVYWSHIRSFFYVFAYAGALILAKTLQSKVADGSLTFAQIKEGQYCHGRDLSPQQIYAQMGIDITDASVWKTGLEQVRAQLSQAQMLADKLKY